jgi:hypothetical protein
VLDLSNPSPGIGVNYAERLNFTSRCQADCLTALALVHHLTITAGVPIPVQADFFADLLQENGLLILEFVPKNDSQVKRLLSLRKDIFEDYELESYIKAFENRFNCIEKKKIGDSERTLAAFRKK